MGQLTLFLTLFPYSKSAPRWNDVADHEKAKDRARVRVRVTAELLNYEDFLYSLELLPCELRELSRTRGEG